MGECKHLVRAGYPPRAHTRAVALRLARLDRVSFVGHGPSVFIIHCSDKKGTVWDVNRAAEGVEQRYSDIILWEPIAS